MLRIVTLTGGRILSMHELNGNRIDIRTERFRLRPLSVSDATQTYLQWLMDPDMRRYIQAAQATSDLEKLRTYIRNYYEDESALFLGIFTRDTGVHIGNIKYHPIDAREGYAVMGIMIGDAMWRGKGVAKEVLKGTADWLKRHLSISKIGLGVDKSNTAAVKSYLAIGFQTVEADWLRIDKAKGHAMVWELAE